MLHLPRYAGAQPLDAEAFGRMTFSELNAIAVRCDKWVGKQRKG